jgi:hypothetical protein
LSAETDFETGEKSFTKQSLEESETRDPAASEHPPRRALLGDRQHAVRLRQRGRDWPIGTSSSDWRDLPAGFKFKEENWYVVIEASHYEVVKVIEFDNQAAIFVILKQLDRFSPRGDCRNRCSV